MNTIEKKLLIEQMYQRMNKLKERIDRDFSSGIQSDLFAYNELKYWRNMVESGKFDVKVWE